MTTYAKAPKGVSIAPYLTPGATYKVLAGINNDMFTINDDDGEMLYCLWSGCGHIKGDSWERVQVLDESSDDDAIIRLAIECGLGDEDLSTDKQVITDYGDTTAAVLTFARRLLAQHQK